MPDDKKPVVKKTPAKKKASLSFMEEILDSGSADTLDIKPKAVELTSEFNVVKNPEVLIQKRVPKVSVTFRCKKSSLDRIIELTEKVKESNPHVTKTDIINSLISKGLENA